MGIQWIISKNLLELLDNEQKKGGSEWKGKVYRKLIAGITEVKWE